MKPNVYPVGPGNVRRMRAGHLAETAFFNSFTGICDTSRNLMRFAGTAVAGPARKSFASAVL
jgi:hypothetical protein